MDITLEYTSLYATVERSLSIIGKRSIDDNGNPLFIDITLGTRETELINDYIRNAVIDLAAELGGFITGETDVTASDTITITLPTNHNSNLEGFIAKSCKAYCVSYALHSWFMLTAPKLVEREAGNMNRQLSAVIRLIHEKKAPVGAHDIVSATSTVIT